MNWNRRTFLAAGAAALAAPGLVLAQDKPNQPAKLPSLDREVGITMSSVARLTGDAGPEKISLLDWPKILREELNLKVIDLNTGVLTSSEPAYLDRVRAAADKEGCILTNLKINRSDINIGHRERAVREKALAECKRWIAAAGHLGLRWARPLPLKEQPDRAAFVASYRELADYAAERNVQMLIENYGWMDSDADAVPQLLKEIERNVAPCPDTGNWASSEVRYAGLAQMFPGAPTCDFKADKLGPDGEHIAWDLKKCFTIGWDASFRGPWCLEHAATDRKTLFRELALLRDFLRGWMKERE